MLQYQFRPIDQWPGEKTKSRRRSPFSATYNKTLDLLERELRYLSAKNVIIQIGCQLPDLRNDGMLRANAHPTWPGVILAFDSRLGPLSYPCDTFDDWPANVRAIALALEALRSVDRYGVTKKGEQYRGWERLTGPTVPMVFQTVQEAADWLRSVGGGNVAEILRSRDVMEDVYRRACFATHPDHHPELQEAFKKVQTAKAILDRHFNSAA